MITKEEYEAAIDIIKQYHLQQARIEIPKQLIDLDLSVRTYTRLKNEFGSCFPVWRFKNVKKSHLMSIEGFGKACLQELEQILSEDNITLL